MTVREALDKIAGESLCHSCGDQRCHACTAHMVRHEMAEEIAPDFERALRAAYLEACLDDDSRKIRDSNHGVTAGVAAMMEES